MTVLDEPEAETASGCTVTLHRSSPEKVVFTETDNTDGWIATDHTRPIER